MRSILAVAVLVPLVAGCVADAARQTPGAAQQPANLPFQVQVVADFESPWAMTFLPDGRMLITEKSGTLYVVSADGQQRKRVDGIPAVASEGQGGLHGRRVAPRLRDRTGSCTSAMPKPARAARGSSSPAASSPMASSLSCRRSRRCSELRPTWKATAIFPAASRSRRTGTSSSPTASVRSSSRRRIRRRRWGRSSASRTTERRRPAIRWPPRDSIRPSGPTVIATCSALRSMRAATSGNRRWVPRAVTK